MSDSETSPLQTAPLEQITTEQATEAGRNFEELLGKNPNITDVVVLVGIRGRKKLVQQETVEFVAGNSKLVVARNSNSPRVGAALLKKVTQSESNSGWEISDQFLFDTTQGSVLRLGRDESDKPLKLGAFTPFNETGKGTLETFLSSTKSVIEASKRPGARIRSVAQKAGRLVSH